MTPGADGSAGGGEPGSGTITGNFAEISVLKETVQIDPDASDYVFYNYGMQLYGNMPLIEPP